MCAANIRLGWSAALQLLIPSEVGQARRRNLDRNTDKRVTVFCIRDRIVVLGKRSYIAAVGCF